MSLLRSSSHRLFRLRDAERQPRVSVKATDFVVGYSSCSTSQGPWEQPRASLSPSLVAVKGACATASSQAVPGYQRPSSAGCGVQRRGPVGHSCWGALHTGGTVHGAPGPGHDSFRPPCLHLVGSLSSARAQLRARGAAGMQTERKESLKQRGFHPSTCVQLRERQPPTI